MNPWLYEVNQYEYTSLCNVSVFQRGAVHGEYIQDTLHFYTNVNIYIIHVEIFM